MITIEESSKSFISQSIVELNRLHDSAKAVLDISRVSSEVSDRDIDELNRVASRYKAVLEETVNIIQKNV